MVTHRTVNSEIVGSTPMCPAHLTENILKLYELAIDNGDGNPITTFRMADDIENLTDNILNLRLNHPLDTISVWETSSKDVLKRITKTAIHIFGQAIVDLEKGIIQLPIQPQQIPIPAGFFEMLNTGPTECDCGHCQTLDSPPKDEEK